MDPSKATGSDLIPAKVLIECANSLSPSLTKIINTSLYSGVVPSIWKKALVCPVHKKGPKKDVRNYRPISLLPICSKVLERCVFNAIFDRLNPKIHRLQHGFRAGMSTTTQLLLVYDKIGGIIDRRGQVDTIFLDFSKAFDSVSHQHLILKLQTFGINGPLLAWFRSYLSNRVQSTIVEGASSDESDVQSGVPQGSILGPILFLLFINDMASEIEANCDLALYADDAKLYCEVNSDQDCLVLQQQLDKLNAWSKTWLLKFNAAKCNVMSITRKISPTKFVYKLGEVALGRVTNFKDLGVTIQDNLLWDIHIRTQVTKANRMLYYIKRTLGLRARMEAKRLLYLSLVRPHLEYSTVSWAPITDINLKLIESIQRRATIFICNDRDLSYNERLTICRFLPLSYRRDLLDAAFCLKSISGNLGPEIQALLPLRDRPGAPLRDLHIRTLVRKAVKTETYMHYYTNRIVASWNRLPTPVRVMEFRLGSQQFKSALNKFFWQLTTTTFDVNNICTWVTKCRCPTCRS